MTGRLAPVLRAARTLRAERYEPGVSLEGLRTVRGWAVRLAAGAAAALLLLVVGYGRIVGPVAWIPQLTAVAVVGALVVRPGPGWGGAVLLLAATRLLAGPVPGAAVLAAALLAGHVTATAGVLAARVPAGGRVELAVLADVARRGWPFQVGVQVLALLLRPLATVGAQGGGPAVVGAEPVAAPWGWLWRTVALVVVVALVAVALPASRRRR